MRRCERVVRRGGLPQIFGEGKRMGRDKPESAKGTPFLSGSNMSSDEDEPAPSPSAAVVARRASRESAAPHV